MNQLTFLYYCYCLTFVIISLVKVYSWKSVFTKETILNWLLELFQLDWLFYFFC